MRFLLQAFDDRAVNVRPQDYRHLRSADRRQHCRLGLGAGGIPQLPGAARHRVSRLQLRAAACGRCRPHRGHRQCHPQADAAGQAAGDRRPVLLARPLDHRGAGLGGGCCDCDRLQGRHGRLPQHRRRHRHAGLGGLPAADRGGQRLHPRQRLPHLPARQERRRICRRRSRPAAWPRAGCWRGSSGRCSA